MSFLRQPSFLLQHSFLLFSVQPSFFLFFCFSPLSCFCSALLFLLSASFLLHLAPPFCCLPVALRFFSFLFDVLPYFFSPKHFFSPNTFSAQEHFQPKTFFSPLLFICGSAPPFFLLFSPSFFLKRLILFFLPTSKAKNILSSCFTSLLFE